MQNKVTNFKNFCKKSLNNIVGINFNNTSSMLKDHINLNNYTNNNRNYSQQMML